MRRTWMVVLGGVVVFACVGCGPSDSPKSGDRRIVKNYDGTYTVQTYRRYPAWEGVGRGNASTLEAARAFKQRIDSDYAKPEVVE